MKKSAKTSETALAKKHSWTKDVKSHFLNKTNNSMLPPATLATAKAPVPPMWVAKPTWSLPQLEAGFSQLLLPQPEVRPSMPPKEIMLGSCIPMKVDDNNPEWLMEEQGYNHLLAHTHCLKETASQRTGTPSQVWPLQRHWRAWEKLPGVLTKRCAHQPCLS